MSFYTLFNIKINNDKEFKAALNALFGINQFKLKQIYKVTGLNMFKRTKFGHLSNYQLQAIKTFLPEIAVFDTDLKRILSANIEKFLELKCYKRNRFLLGLPARGQRTRTNAQNAHRLKRV